MRLKWNDTVAREKVALLEGFKLKRSREAPLPSLTVLASRFAKQSLKKTHFITPVDIQVVDSQDFFAAAC